MQQVADAERLYVVHAAWCCQCGTQAPNLACTRQATQTAALGASVPLDYRVDGQVMHGHAHCCSSGIKPSPMSAKSTLTPACHCLWANASREGQSAARKANERGLFVRATPSCTGPK